MFSMLFSCRVMPEHTDLYRQAARCDAVEYRVLPGCTGASEQTWSKHGIRVPHDRRSRSVTGAAGVRRPEGYLAPYAAVLRLRMSGSGQADCGAGGMDLRETCDVPPLDLAEQAARPTGLDQSSKRGGRER
jgi:hypothetical protein